MIINTVVKKTTLMFILCVLQFSLIHFDASAQKGSITIIRENMFIDSQNETIIYMDKKPIVSLQVNSYITKELDSGKYTLSVMGYDKGKTEVTLAESENKYFILTIKSGVFSANYALMSVDSVYANSAIKTKGYKKVSDSDALPERKKSRIGMNFGGGIGLKNIDMLVSTEGDNSSISFGGGLQIGAEYGIELNSFLDLGFQANYMMASLAPPLKNADIDFSRFHVAFRPSFIIPIEDGLKSRIKLGPGFDYYFGSTMKFETNKIDGGFNGDWKYSASLGWHIALVYEYTINRNLMYTFGLRYSAAKYSYKESNSFMVPIDRDLINGNGNSIDFMIGFYKTF